MHAARICMRTIYLFYCGPDISLPFPSTRVITTGRELSQATYPVSPLFARNGLGLPSIVVRSYPIWLAGALVRSNARTTCGNLDCRRSVPVSWESGVAPRAGPAADYEQTLDTDGHRYCRRCSGYTWSGPNFGSVVSSSGNGSRLAVSRASNYVRVYELSDPRTSRASSLSRPQISDPRYQVSRDRHQLRSVKRPNISWLRDLETCALS